MKVSKDDRPQSAFLPAADFQMQMPQFWQMGIGHSNYVLVDLQLENATVRDDGAVSRFMYGTVSL